MEFDEMVAFAVSECGLSIEQFRALSWFEWSLEVLKVRKRNEWRNLKQELEWRRAGEVMSLIANVYRDSKQKPTPFVWSDFTPKLSFEVEQPEEDTRSFDEIVKEKWRRIPNGN